MILQLIIRLPNEQLDESILVGTFLTKTTCEKHCQSLLNGAIPSDLKKLGLRQYPQGYYIEGVFYGEWEDEEPIDAYDLYLKVLH